MLSFWGKLVTSNECRLSRIMYCLLYNDTMNRGFTYKWLDYMQLILNQTGNTNIWINQHHILKFYGNGIKRTIDDIAVQEIRGKCRESNKGRNYLNLKEGWMMETYLQVLDDSEAFNLFKFRTSNHRLPIETGRFNETDYKDRICPKCNSDIGDEFHYFMQCPFLNKERKLLLNTSLFKNPSMANVIDIFKSPDFKLLNKISIFARVIMNKIKT